MGLHLQRKIVASIQGLVVAFLVASILLGTRAHYYRLENLILLLPIVLLSYFIVAIIANLISLTRLSRSWTYSWTPDL